MPSGIHFRDVPIPLPDRIRLLFVCEAPPPAADNYFYHLHPTPPSPWKERSFFWGMMQGVGLARPLDHRTRSEADLLKAFFDAGYFLIDANPAPVASGPGFVTDPAAVKGTLFSEIDALRPEWIVFVCDSNRRVLDAYRSERATFPLLSDRPLAYPGMGWLKRFAEEFDRVWPVRILERVWAALLRCCRTCTVPEKAKGEWTKAIAEAVRGVAPSEHGNCRVRVCGHGMYHPEYLLDQVWNLEGDSVPWEPTENRGLMLALECEWVPDREERWTDAVKLADVRADVRVLIAAIPSQGPEGGRVGMQCFVDEFRLFVSRHRHRRPSDLYLLALYYSGSEPPDTGLHGFVVDAADGSYRVL